MASSAPLSELCELIADCPHSTPKWTDDGIIVLRSNNIRVGRLSLNDPSFTDERHYLARVRRAVPQEGDIVITREAPMGELCMIPGGLKCCLGQRMVLLRPDRGKVVPKFLLYALQSDHVQRNIRTHEGTGSTVSNLRIPALEALEIPLLERQEQTQAANILASIDDQIDRLRILSDTLESIARAVFKAWFVDFDPVRAKADGREPEGMDAATAALFPDSFDEPERGTIPKGWQVAPLAALCESIMSGGTPSTQHPEYWAGDIPWLSSGETRQKFITNTEKTISDEGVKKSSTRMARAGSTVIASAGQGHTRGQTSFLLFDSYINQSVIALSGEEDRVSDFFLFWNLEMRYEQFRQISDSQSSRGSLTGKLLSELRIVVPPRRIITAFDDLTAPFVYRIAEGLRQSAALNELRDTLLPRLISGKLRVPEAEKLVEAVL